MRFNDYTDLMMCSTRLGKDGEFSQFAGPREKSDDLRQRRLSWVIFQIDFGKTKNKYDEVEPLTRAHVKQVRVFVYHVHHEAISTSTSAVGESNAVMIWECMMYQVDISQEMGTRLATMLSQRKVLNKCQPIQIAWSNSG